MPRRKKPLTDLVVLVVEDDFLIAIEAQRIAEESGATVILANSMAAARERLASGIPIDVALLDLKLGPDDGLPLVEEVRAKGLRVVVASGFDAGSALAGIPVVSKPYRDADLVAGICAALGKSAGFPGTSSCPRNS